MGEIHPEVLKAFGLRNPTAFLELDLQALSSVWEKGKKRI